MTAAMHVERKYVLTKVAPGDYLLPSNDGRTIWRIARYDERPNWRLWGLWRWNGPSLGVDVSHDGWGLWEMVDSRCETRADAIRQAMRMA
jgi:hypothetical protein